MYQAIQLLEVPNLAEHNFHSDRAEIVEQISEGGNEGHAAEQGAVIGSGWGLF